MRRPARSSARSSTCARPTTLRAGEDLDVLEALSRLPDQSLRGLADLEAPGDKPVAELPALQATRRSVEALREGPAWSPRADRREVHRPAQGHTQEALSVHRDHGIGHVYIKPATPRLN